MDAAAMLDEAEALPRTRTRRIGRLPVMQAFHPAPRLVPTPAGD